MSRLSNLYRVQDIDLQMEGNQKRLEEIQRLLADNEALKKLRSAAAKSEERMSESRRSLASAEHDVTIQRQKIAGAEHRLYSGNVKNPKELEDIQNEAASLKRHLSALEDRQLEAMISMEEAEKQHLLDTEEVEKEEIRSEVNNKNLLDEKARLEQDLERLASEREAAVAVTNPSDLNVYLSLKPRLGSKVISLIKEGSCSICGMIVAGSTIQIVRSGNEIQRCSQCNRILYAG